MLRPAIAAVATIAAIAAAAPIAPATAAPVRFDTLRAFRAASGPTVVERFGGCGVATVAFAGALAAGGNGPCAPGAIRPGLTFSDDPGPWGQQLYLAGPGYGANRTAALGQTDPAADALRIRFDTPVHAVGFTVFQNLGGGATRSAPLPVHVALFDGSNLLLAAFEVAVGARGAFFGAVDADARIARATINSPLSFDMIDDVRFSAPVAPRFAATATPAQGALALFGLGVWAIGLRARRR